MRVLLTVLSLAAMLTAGCDFLDSKPHVGVVDMKRIVADSGPGRQAVAQSDKAREIFQTNLNTIQTKLAAYPDKQQAGALLATAHTDLQRRLQQEQAAISSQVTGQLRKVIRDYRAENKLDFIVSRENVLEYGEAMDITPAILAKFEAVKLTLPPLPKLEPNPVLPAPKPAPAPAKEEEKSVKKEAPQQARQPVRNRRK